MSQSVDRAERQHGQNARSVGDCALRNASLLSTVNVTGAKAATSMGSRAGAERVRPRDGTGLNWMPRRGRAGRHKEELPSTRSFFRA
jgi:hypothetical protein